MLPAWSPYPFPWESVDRIKTFFMKKKYLDLPTFKEICQTMSEFINLVYIKVPTGGAHKDPRLPTIGNL